MHSEAQLGNSLTKKNGGKELELFYKMQHTWRVVEDALMRSARKRKVAGLESLEGDSKAEPGFQKVLPGQNGERGTGGDARCTAHLDCSFVTSHDIATD